MEIGKRVRVVGGAWAGHSGEYAGMQKTPIGELHRVNLDNGMSTLVPADQIRPTPRAGGIAVGSDKPVLSGSDNSTVTEAGSPALR